MPDRARSLPAPLIGHSVARWPRYHGPLYIYEGKNILDPTTPLSEMASMVVRAKGKSGACFDYVRRTFEGLGSIGLDDPAVTSLWEAVKDHASRTN